MRQAREVYARVHGALYVTCLQGGAFPMYSHPIGKIISDSVYDPVADMAFDQWSPMTSEVTRELGPWQRW